MHRPVFGVQCSRFADIWEPEVAAEGAPGLLPLRYDALLTGASNRAQAMCAGPFLPPQYSSELQANRDMMVFNQNDPVFARPARFLGSPAAPFHGNYLSTSLPDSSGWGSPPLAPEPPLYWATARPLMSPLPWMPPVPPPWYFNQAAGGESRVLLTCSGVHHVPGLQPAYST